ncbi:MAG TPA: thioredoxin family protein [Anaerolineales bacterium]
MDSNFFEKGETVEQFRSGLKDNQAKFDQLLAESELGEAQRRQAAQLPAGLHVLVIAEPWSGDVLYNLPPLLRLAEAAGWEVRIFHRDQYPELILPYRKDGLYRSIPVFVFYDREFNELGHWVERPAAATRLIDDESLKLRRRLREEHKDEWRQDALQELTSLVEKPA